MDNHNQRVASAMERMPLVAILRGLEPEKARQVGQTLVDAGFTLIEVPLNSPKPCKSISLLRAALPSDIVIGAGTVLSVAQAKDVYQAGGEIIVSPNVDQDVIRFSIEAGMVPMPGFATATEAFAAAHAGANFLKLFPATAYPVKYVSDLKSVLPEHVKVLAVGGIDNNNGRDYLDAGCSGLGLSSYLFKPTTSLEQISNSAQQMVNLASTQSTLVSKTED